MSHNPFERPPRPGGPPDQSGVRPVPNRPMEMGHATGKGTIEGLIAERGFGYIRTEEGKQLEFRQNQLQGVDFTSLKVGQAVEYEVVTQRGGELEVTKMKISSS